MNDLEKLKVVNMGIDTHEEPLVYMHKECDVCRAEGFFANARVQVSAGDKKIIATLNIVTGALLSSGRVGFSTSAWRYLALDDEATVAVTHAPVVASLRFLRKKIHGHELNAEELEAIISDISRRLYSDIEVASFLTACAGDRLSMDEIIALTRAMVTVGNRLTWPEYPRVFDKHCVGGLPGNRTTPIVIAIASAAGLIMPKTSSRAITSPAGTADTLEVLTEVNLSLVLLQQVVHQTGACLAWGGRMNLSPTDDLLIRIEKALDIDSDGQLVASVLSKKIAAGSSHILIDIPVGPTAKVRDSAHAQRLATMFETVASALGVMVRCVVTDGTQTIGRGIGPVPEARDVLAVLQNDAAAPPDLAARSVFLASHLLSMAGGKPQAEYVAQAEQLLTTGEAWQQFERICVAQGGLKPLPEAAYSTELNARSSGTLVVTDNRRLAQLAKLAGAPNSPVSGLYLAVKVGAQVTTGQPLAQLFAATQGELDYALDYYRANRDLFVIE